MISPSPSHRPGPDAVAGSAVAAQPAFQAAPTTRRTAQGQSARMASFRDTLALMLKARFPVLYVESFEEQRVIAEVVAVASDMERVRTPRAVWFWSATQGLTSIDGETAPATTDPGKALDWILKRDDPPVYIFRALHPSLGHRAHTAAAPPAVRRLRDSPPA